MLIYGKYIDILCSLRSSLAFTEQNANFILIKIVSKVNRGIILTGLEIKIRYRCS